MNSISKVRSFTLSELLVVMIITAIVVGLAFTILNLVQKQIKIIVKNYERTSELQLIEQMLWQDFNTFPVKYYHDGNLVMQSDLDTVTYIFNDSFSLRNADTLKSRINVVKLYNDATEVKSGPINALLLSAEKELPNYIMFISSKHDAAHYINKDGL